ncbi:MAG: DUF3034 family protein [Burkholderiales bacterium]|nr:DUF3034 family protein [Burkholderiales bacterium]
MLDLYSRGGRRPAAALAAALAALGLFASTPAHAGDGKLLLTGGVSSIDGAAGGGLTPWAVTGTYATRGQWGVSAYATAARTQDYGLAVSGAAASWDNRVELSFARQDFDTRDNLAALGLAGLHLKLDVWGLKLRVAGEAILDSDRWTPQIAIGVLHKRVDAGALAPTLTGALGAAPSGTDVYVSATKLFLAPGLLANLTLRLTQANQGGLLGYGGAQGQGRRIEPEFSLAWLASRHLAFGLEGRAQPDNLDRSVLGTGALKADDWFDVFAAWAPNKTVSLTLAWVDLGRIVPALQPRRQNGAYLSAQLAY